MRKSDFLLILIVVSIWGTNFVAIRWGLDDMPPLFFTGLRFFLVAFPFIFLIPKPNAELHHIVLLGLFICTMQFSLLFLAISLGLPAGIASLVMQVQVVFTLILSAIIFGERVSAGQALGVVIAFLGFGVLLWSEQSADASLLPYLIALVAALSWAAGNLVYKTAQNANRFHLTIYASLVAPIPMFALSFLLESQTPWVILREISPKGWGSLFYNSILSTIVAYGLWGTLLGRYASILITPWALTIPIFGMGSAALLLGERFTFLDVIASLLILTGLAISMLTTEPKNRNERYANG